MQQQGVLQEIKNFARFNTIKQMDTIQILFFSLSALALFSAIMVLVSKNPVHSVLWLVAVFFAISGHYILLNAQFLAIVN